MRKLLLQVLLLLSLVGLVAGAVLWQALQRPYLDAFYTRFTTPTAGSLVLGTSRAAQGVLPAVLRAQLGSRYAGPWLNYAFTLAESPYGPAYLASVRRKLAPGTKNGLFVLAVDPWSLSLAGPGAPGEAVVFPEDQGMIGQLHLVNQNPNPEYLARFLHRPLYEVLSRDTTSIEHLHPDGWLEIDLPNPAEDTSLLHERTADKLFTYRAVAASSHLSAARLAALSQIIGLLQPHGRVVLVRLPTGPGLATLEAQYQPGFDALMQHTAATLGVLYLNYIGLSYPTNDGNHLWRGAAHEFSQRLAADIERQ
ncbi:MAG: hypothetical protein ACRYFX_28750 [Janthinobacterium lividum]